MSAFEQLFADDGFFHLHIRRGIGRCVGEPKEGFEVMYRVMIDVQIQLLQIHYILWLGDNGGNYP